jgi:diguanylate cyclase (GGDEF)-like protein/PAS domain S-box-containing protein
MVWKKTIIPERQSIVRQATLRLVFSLGLFVLLLGYSSYTLYSVALQKSAHERTADLSAFYRTRLMQLDRDWELQTRDFKVRLEVTRLLEDRKNSLANLQAFMTVQGTNRRFQYMLIEDRLGNKMFTFGTDLDLEKIPLPPDEDSGWYFADNSGSLYRVFVVPIWLGESGTGRMAVFYKVDNALLFNLATPGIQLTIKRDGKPLASSSGQAGLEYAKPANDRSDAAERREIPWTTGDSEKTLLCIEAPIKVLFTKTELVLGAAAIPLIDGLILWFTLGFWLMRNARRISELGEAVEEFAVQRQPTALLEKKLETAQDQQLDEISEVAVSLKDMIDQSVLRERERQAEAAQQRLWSMVFASTNEAILITDRNNNIVTVNAVFTRLTGYTEAEVVGQNPQILSSGLQPREFYKEMWKQLRENDCWAGEVQDRRKDGSLYPKWLNVSVVRDAAGNVTNYLGIFHDITERKANEERLAHLANHDTLTGLPNRHLLLDRMQNAITLARRTNETVALMFLDLDNFKWVNDALGHESGDQLLIAVAARLRETVRVSDTVARLGGDEFVVLFTQIDSDVELAQIASKIIAAVAKPLELAGHDFHVTTSMGIGMYPNDGEDAATLLKHADTAMYVAKSDGKNQYRYFDAAMNRNVLERVELEQDLRQALKNEEFELHYQPKFDIAGNSVTAAEALIRWRHPRLGLRSPDKFIPLAEETALIIEIGEWVIRTACQQIVTWQAEGLGLRRVAVNLSAIQLESDTLIDTVAHILRETGAPVEAIEFELTESMILRNPDRSVVTLNRLHDLGIHLSLDDFGTGYSSLSYLKRLPVDTLKIDRSFVEGLPGDTNDTQIVRMICALAKSVHLEIVAEGIETEAQRDFLMAHGCDYLQGYLISKPLPAEEFRECDVRGVAGHYPLHSIEHIAFSNHASRLVQPLGLNAKFSDITLKES